MNWEQIQKVSKNPERRCVHGEELFQSVHKLVVPLNISKEEDSGIGSHPGYLKKGAEFGKKE